VADTNQWADWGFSKLGSSMSSINKEKYLKSLEKIYIILEAAFS
jgi:hypothetical protein